MTQDRLKCKICGKVENIEIMPPKRLDPENDIELDMGNVYVRKITK